MKKIERENLCNLLSRAGIPVRAIYAGVKLDENFVIPTSKWLLDFSRALAYQITVNFGDFAEESSDCDDYALFNMSIMRLWHRKSSRNGTLPVGFVAYTKEDGERHAICFALVDNFRVMFFEPQSGSELFLTQKEKNSCDFLLF